MPESKIPFNKKVPHTTIEPFSMGHIVSHRDKSMHIFDKDGYSSTGEHIMDHLADHLDLHSGTSEDLEAVGPKVRKEARSMDRYGEGAFSANGTDGKKDD